MQRTKKSPHQEMEDMSVDAGEELLQGQIARRTKHSHHGGEAQRETGIRGLV
jgi:hypothetical protein